MMAYGYETPPKQTTNVPLTVRISDSLDTTQQLPHQVGNLQTRHGTRFGGNAHRVSTTHTAFVMGRMGSENSYVNAGCLAASASPTLSARKTVWFLLPSFMHTMG